MCTLKNHIVLISNSNCPEFTSYSFDKFQENKEFLFFGWVIPPEGNQKEHLKILVDIDGPTFIKKYSKF